MSEGLYKTELLAGWFKRSRQTIRSWAMEFEVYLSANANPGTGVHRNFTHDDLTVMSLIAEMKQQGLPFEEIHIALANGQRGDIPAAVFESDEKMLVLQRELIDQQLEIMRTERDTAILEAVMMKEKIANLEGRLETEEASRERAENEADAVRLEVRKLEREIGKLEAMIEILKAKDD